MIKAFISYSHNDESYLQKLKTALSQIKRQDLMQDWSDHDIDVSSRLNEKIAEELNSSQLFIALLSADYLASRYCYDQEFHRAQQLEEEGNIKILPIICRPCDWKNSPFSGFKALPRDGKPISEWQNEDSAFFNISEMIRSFIQQSGPSEIPFICSNPQVTRKFSGNYKVRKDFDIVQKSDFLDKAYIEVKDFLKDYLEELAAVVNVTYKILDSTDRSIRYFLVNRDKGIAECECSILKSLEKANSQYFRFNEGDLNIIFVKDNREETMSFTLSYDEYEMYFLIRNLSYNNSSLEKRYDSKAIANEIWKKWLTHIGIDVV